MACIYRITNLIDEKTYIGKTTKTIEHRWKVHVADSKRHKSKLYNAMNKHGHENFIIEVFEECHPNISREKLNEREKYWIDVLEPDYNMTKGGDGGWINDQTGKTWKIKDTSNMKKPKTQTQKSIDGHKRLTGGSNYQSIYFIHTPWGIFETWLAAEEKAKELKSQGVVEVITTAKSIRRYCEQDFILNINGKRTPRPWRGCSTRQLGFYLERK